MGRGKYWSGRTIKNFFGKDIPLYNKMPKGWKVDNQAQDDISDR